MLFDESICKDVLHVACIEVAVCDVVVCRIDLCVFDSFRNIFNTNHFRRLTRHELSDCTCTCVEVINYLGTCQSCILARYAVELVCLFCICLIE